jgi:hypothetical protein
VGVEKRRVRVKPGSRKGPLVETGSDGILVVHVRERAVDGAANAAALEALAEYWRVPRRNLAIATGHTARIKTVAVETP